ncbi:MAG: hypothetical protein ABIF82_06220 [Planctomycetota bacterium]
MPDLREWRTQDGGRTSAKKTRDDNANLAKMNADLAKLAKMDATANFLMTAGCLITLAVFGIPVLIILFIVLFG